MNSYDYMDLEATSSLLPSSAAPPSLLCPSGFPGLTHQTATYLLCSSPGAAYSKFACSPFYLYIPGRGSDSIWAGLVLLCSVHSCWHSRYTLILPASVYSFAVRLDTILLLHSFCTSTHNYCTDWRSYGTATRPWDFGGSPPSPGTYSLPRPL